MPRACALLHREQKRIDMTIPAAASFVIFVSICFITMTFRLDKAQVVVLLAALLRFTLSS
jgi:hypothetical protein